MSDLYERLRFAVNVRLDVARSATEGPWEYATVDGHTYVGRPDTLPSVAEVEFGADVHHILANAPDATVRHCERDLRVLKRHEPVQSTWPGRTCWHDRGYVGWHCAEIRDLAEAYGVRTEDGAS